MNRVDLALLLVGAACALRGYGRGFFRESFGLLALVAAVAAAFRFTASGMAVIEQYIMLPAPAQTGVAFVAIFVLVHSAMNLIGVALDRLVGTGLLRAVTGAAGALLGVGKAAVVCGFVLLFLHLFPVLSGLDEHLMASAIGRPLVNAAGNAIRVGLQSGAAPSSGSDA